MRDTIIQGDALTVLKRLPDGLVDCVVTSPPYWGLRDYGVPDQLGLEPTLDEYIDKLVAVFREMRRVLKDDGTVWVNMGDAYTSGGRPDRDSSLVSRTSGLTNRSAGLSRAQTPAGLKPKDLIGQPWRLAFALQADGWYLRSDIIWSKPNPMPESVTDRPTKAHEYVFLMSKQARYYYDQEAIKESCESGPSDIRKMKESLPRIGGKHKVLVDPFNKASSATQIGQKRAVGDPSGRNRRTVWTIATGGFSEAHFATFPEKLVEPCIRAGTSERGNCAECGKPWVRVVEVELVPTKKAAKTFVRDARDSMGNITNDQGSNRQRDGHKPGWRNEVTTVGWRPSCDCYDLFYREYPRVKSARRRRQQDIANRWFCRVKKRPGKKEWDTVPPIVLDPFMGSGTVALVAKKLGRDFLGVELNPEYIEIAWRRLNAEIPLLLQEAE